jgi:hypothetical protein
MGVNTFFFLWIAYFGYDETKYRPFSRGLKYIFCGLSAVRSVCRLTASQWGIDLVWVGIEEASES